MLPSCSEREAKPQPSAREEGKLEAFFVQAPPDKALCKGNKTADLAAHIPVRLWVSSKVPTEGLTRYTRSLERVFAVYGLRFEQLGEMRRFEQDPLFIAAAASLPSTQVADASAPLRVLIGGIESGSAVQIFFVDRIIASDSAMQNVLPHAAGFTISPHISEDADRRLLGQLVGRPLEELPGPLVFLSMQELAHIEPARRFDTLAHEIGHALGLGHSGGKEKLMSTIRHTHCLPGLDADELRSVADVLRRPR